MVVTNAEFREDCNLLIHLRQLEMNIARTTTSIGNSIWVRCYFRLKARLQETAAGSAQKLQPKYQDQNSSLTGCPRRSLATTSLRITSEAGIIPAEQKFGGFREINGRSE